VEIVFYRPVPTNGRAEFIREQDRVADVVLLSKKSLMSSRRVRCLSFTDKMFGNIVAASAFFSRIFATVVALVAYDQMG
jgi:hypothetical protein